MNERSYSHHFEAGLAVNAPRETLFAELDDHEKLSAHMMQSSPMMAGSAMRFDFDEMHGRAIGSEIRMSGKMMGMTLEVREVVRERDPPRRKVWETVGSPRLLVIGDYRMGFTIDPLPNGSSLTVFIDYDDPAGAWAPLGWLLGPMYARWCTASMAEGAKAAFA
jgi:hypothetical protein